MRIHRAVENLGKRLSTEYFLLRMDTSAHFIIETKEGNTFLLMNAITARQLH